jgi:polysaccharide biosynthesis/export protein
MRPLRLSRCLLVVLVAALALAGCARRQAAYYAQPGIGGPYVAAYAGQGAVPQPSYTLDTGDRVRVSVFGQEGVSNSYLVDVREPHVSVEVEAYRPFYILGEVNAPGQYPYQPGMSVETAIAVAGGYSPRADKRNALLSRAINGAPIKSKVPLHTPLRPGDTVDVAERWF